MRKKFLFGLLALLLMVGGITLGYYIRNQTLNPRATIPSVLERVLAFLVKTGKIEEDDLLYHDTGLVDFIANGSEKTKVSVEGIVDQVEQEPDGDAHVTIRPLYSPLPALVTEFIPEMTVPLPKVGDHIKIWGITRFDVPHNWWELHPVIGWKML